MDDETREPPTTDEVTQAPPDGPRSARDVGGPTADPASEPQHGAQDTGAHGDIKTRGFEDDPHE
jgi:hypothetical protein